MRSSSGTIPRSAATGCDNEQQFPLAGLVVACGGLEPLGWECSDRSGERSPRSVALC